MLFLPLKCFAEFYGKTIREFNERVLTKINVTTSDDITWIKHECAERHHELKYSSGYNEAHNRAQTRFDGTPWENQF